VEKETSSGTQGATISFLKYAVVSIDGTPNDGSLKIMNFLENLPSKDVATIKQFYANNRPDIDFNIKLECKKCNHSREGSVPITVNFFWPES